MDNSKFNPNQLLSDFGNMPEGLLAKLKGCNIITAGDLLGKTMGLSRFLELFETEDEKEFHKHLLDQIPEEVLLKYKDFYFRPELGCFLPKKEAKDNRINEKDENNEKEQ